MLQKLYITDGWLILMKKLEMAFLLDGFTLGHGYGIRGNGIKVPIIVPANRKVRSMIDNIMENSSLVYLKKIEQYLEKYFLKLNR